MKRLVEPMTEADLQYAVTGMARAFGWLVHHDRPARTKAGEWRVHVEGDPGFPDLVLSRDGETLFVELKSARGRLTEAQAAWRGTLDTIVWRPADLRDGTIEAVLR